MLGMTRRRTTKMRTKRRRSFNQLINSLKLLNEFKMTSRVTI